MIHSQKLNLPEGVLDCSQGIADWLCMVQAPPVGENMPPVGFMPFIVRPGTREEHPAQNWNYAFGIMGLLGAYRIFGEPRYEAAALNMGRYLKQLQIFDPFHKEDYGAIREVTPYTPWCYTRDALSVAWSFIELYRHTKDSEWLERARLWGEWFLRKGRDEEGWPYWGHTFDPLFEAVQPWPVMRNDIQGSFQTGSLNFLYQMALETGDDSWIGKPFTDIADHCVNYIQQDSGFFAPIERKTKKPPEKDPQGGLHRINDDLATLGLLCAYKATGDDQYLNSIKKYLHAVINAQREDGRFEDSVACIPLILNLLIEGSSVLETSYPDSFVESATTALLSSQSDGRFNPRMRGGILEYGPDHILSVESREQNYVCARSSCYALIVLPKLVGQEVPFLKGPY